MNHALWPLILERAYNNSSEIYIYDSDGWDDASEAESKKCATGLFHLVHRFYAPVLVQDRGGSSTATTNLSNDISSEGSNNNNTRNELKGKRKRK